jgi:catechol 2,3-dioxygenase-like lactoylglutathione lyase family enzyme
MVPVDSPERQGFGATPAADGDRPARRGIVVAVFDHVAIRVTDRAASKRFYSTVLGTLGVQQAYSDDAFVEWDDDFSIGAADAEHPVTRRLHIAWFAPTVDDVQVFWQVGIDAEYHPSYYGAYVLDPDGNNVAVVDHNHS